jgi:hypothetical protein
MHTFARIGVVSLFLLFSLGRFTPASASWQEPCKKENAFLKVISLDDKREIIFGLTKDCTQASAPFWIIDFSLKERSGVELTTRVEVHVPVEEKNAQKAEQLAQTKELTPPKVNFLKGRVADRASELPKGTTADPELQKLLMRVL